MALTGVVSYSRQLVRALLTGLFETTSNELYSVQVRSVSNTQLQLTAVSSGRGLHVMHVSQLKRKWVHGDDAYFIARHKLADVLGVADGVGGWRSYGVDPSKFSSTLMSTCAQLVQRNAFQPHQPAAIMASSYYEILDAKQGMIGSCTACIVSFNHADSTLYAANLGDSGFLVVRGNRIVHRSREQQHYFNAPYQLAAVPPDQRGLVFSDKPEAADQSSFSLQEGDIVVVGTDGLFDNVDDATLLSFLPALVEDDRTDSIQRVADAIVRRAVELSRDPKHNSPFARHAMANGYLLNGGKPDDVTLLLAKVTRMQANSDSDCDADKRRSQSLGDINNDKQTSSHRGGTCETRYAEHESAKKLFVDANISSPIASPTNANRYVPTPLLKSVSDVVAQPAATSLGLRMCASAPSLLSLSAEALNAKPSADSISLDAPLSRSDSCTNIFTLPLD